MKKIFLSILFSLVLSVGTFAKVSVTVSRKKKVAVDAIKSVVKGVF